MMSRKIFLGLVLAVALLMTVGGLQAATYVFYSTQATGDGLWNTVSNWMPNDKTYVPYTVLPGSGDTVYIASGNDAGGTLAQLPTIDSGNHSIANLHIGAATSPLFSEETIPGAILTMTGGTLAVSTQLQMGWNYGDDNRLVMSGGAEFNLASTNFKFGDREGATLDVSDGASFETVAYMRFGYVANASVQKDLRLYIDGGTVTVGPGNVTYAGAFEMKNDANWTSQTDIKNGGKLIIRENFGTYPNLLTYITGGYLTASEADEELTITRCYYVAYANNRTIISTTDGTAPGKDVLFADDFERDGGATGKVFTLAEGAPADKAWTGHNFSSANGGIQPAAKLTGDNGCEITASAQSTGIRLQKTLTVTGESTMIFEMDFYMKAGISDTGTNRPWLLATQMAGAAAGEIDVELDIVSSGTHRIRLRGKDDNNVTINSQYIPGLEDGKWYHMEVVHTTATAAASNDGSLVMTLNEVGNELSYQQCSIENVDNFAQTSIEDLRIGWASNPSSLTGTMYFDNFSFSKPAPVGPLLGDFNNDQSVDTLDIPEAKKALSDKAQWNIDNAPRDADTIGDYNEDDVYNALDLPDFKDDVQP